MVYPNKYEDPVERAKLRASLTREELAAVHLIVQARQKIREQEFYSYHPYAKKETPSRRKKSDS